MIVAESTETQAEIVKYTPKRTSYDPIASLQVEEAKRFIPPFPQTPDQLDVPIGFLSDLTLKMMSIAPDSTTADVARRIHLGVVITDTLLQRLTRDKFIEAKGVVGLHNHRYAMLERGWNEIKRITESNTYAGPAPVSLDSYSEKVTKQIRGRLTATRNALERAMNDLILSDSAKQTLGLVASSGRSLFLSGPSGNGKTAMARALVDAIEADFWIPYAIEVDGQVIRLFDPHTHQPVKITEEDYDHRWIKIRPPLVVVGGELTIESMELSHTTTQRFYEAPFHIKSNGGVLVVDDLGRQRCSATDLLNRWIIPLENRVDFLTLSTGKKIQVPFEQVVVFATNLTVSDLADEAFLRRMGYRMYVMPPGPDTYAEIFARHARKYGLAVDPELLAHIEKRYGMERRTPKACEPRDLIDRAVETCKYRREAIRLSQDVIDLAWDGYFGASASG